MLETQVSPVTGSEAEFSAWMVWVSPTDMLRQMRLAPLRPKRITPFITLLNPRDAGQRAGGDRGDHLRVAPTDHLAGGAAQPNHATALRGPEAAARKRDLSSGY